MYASKNRAKAGLAVACAGVVTLGLVTAPPPEAHPVVSPAENNAVQLVAVVRPASANAAASIAVPAKTRAPAAAANPSVRQAATIERSITEGIATIVGVGIGLVNAPLWYLLVPFIVFIQIGLSAGIPNPVPLSERIFNLLVTPFDAGIATAYSLFGLTDTAEASAAEPGIVRTPATRPGPARPVVARTTAQHAGPKAVSIRTGKAVRAFEARVSTNKKSSTAAPLSARHATIGTSTKKAALRSGTDRDAGSSSNTKKAR